jgi:hypothetical protein
MKFVTHKQEIGMHLSAMLTRLNRGITIHSPGLRPLMILEGRLMYLFALVAAAAKAHLAARIRRLIVPDTP